MTRKPKSIQNHYTDSFTINFSSLQHLLNNSQISFSELEHISLLISTCYTNKIEIILKSCGENWSKLESFSSPLILFIQCIDKVVNDRSVNMSLECRLILKSFLKSLESWMIW